MTTSNQIDVLRELRDKQQRVWSSGDYNKIAAITVPVAEHLVEVAAVSPGERVLDVATGTGHVALAAARRSAVVSGIDYVPALVDIARRRAAAEDLTVDFTVADAEGLPYDDASFDVVISSIGVMFAADHARAASELVRVARPGGRLLTRATVATRANPVAAALVRRAAALAHGDHDDVVALAATFDHLGAHYQRDRSRELAAGW